MFSSLEMLALGFVPTEVLHLVRKMLEDKLPMPSLEVAQVITDSFTKEDLAKLRAKVAAEAISIFEENVVHQMTPHPPFDVSLAPCVAYLADIAVRSARKRQSLRPGIVRLVNDNNVLVVNRMDGHTTRATLL